MAEPDSFIELLLLDAWVTAGSIVFTRRPPSGSRLHLATHSWFVAVVLPMMPNLPPVEN
jgi:hypothetical protein